MITLFLLKMFKCADFESTGDTKALFGPKMHSLKDQKHIVNTDLARMVLLIRKQLPGHRSFNIHSSLITLGNEVIESAKDNMEGPLSRV